MLTVLCPEFKETRCFSLIKFIKLDMNFSIIQVYLKNIEDFFLP